MAATTAQKAQLRRMVAETASTTYADADIASYIEAHPLTDARGENPWVESETAPGTLEANPDWTATYDLNAAAADIWDEKAAALAPNFDFEADGGRYDRSQAFEQAQKMARYYRSRRSAKTITQFPEPLAQGTEETDLDEED